MTATIGVIAVAGAKQLRRCLEQLVPQTIDLPLEVMVPYDAALPGVDELRADFPHVTFVDLGRLPATSDGQAAVVRHEQFEMRVSAVLSRARGSHVALLQDWGVPAPDWCRHLMDAVLLPHAAIGGAIDHRAPTLLNWAVYLLDFGRYQPPLRGGPSQSLSDVNIIYRRQDLEDIRPLWNEQYNEVIVNSRLLKRGNVLWRMPGLVVQHTREPLSFSAAAAERYGWGRVFGAVRAQTMPSARIVLYVLLSPLIPLVITARTAAIVFARKRNRVRFIQALPALLVFALIWTAGELVGYLTRRPARAVRSGRVQIAG